MTLRRSALALGLLGLLPLALEAAELSPENFTVLAARIKPQPGESRWLDISWHLDLHEARRQAAAAGKPLFVYSGGGATGIGAC
jgi:hypothetical protein